MSKISALTTVDNPYSPFDDFNKWFMYDNDHGYDTCGYLARLSNTSDALTPKENEIALEEAMRDIIRLDFTGKYKRVEKEVPDEEQEEYYEEEAN